MSEEIDNNEITDNTDSTQEHSEDLRNITHLAGMYENWFLDYASYVILERAVPHLDDGLKPVHRRILHSMDDLDDGRYNKVANIIGHTMKYHPHGDASIGDALVQLGQKDLLIDTQGNWGNILTGDNAAAPRYIEARLSKLALEILFNPKVTEWKASYDGRNREPVTLPVKFPLLLAQGVEGIAVGLASKILPHNFNELIDGSIEILKGNKVYIFPDFQTCGLVDVIRYNDGLRGGKVRIRARINQLDKKTLIIKEIPFGTTTTSLIDSIVTANDKGKIKIKKIEDNTSSEVEILVHLAPGISPDQTIDALYAFTDCEVSISPNSCVISNDKPQFLGVSEMLKNSTFRTVDLLRKELEITKAELEEQHFFCSLEKIFINDEMYIDFKKYSDKPTLFEYLNKRFTKYKKKLIREITNEDYDKLTQIPMIRITRFDSSKADEKLLQLDENIKEVENHLENLVDYAINYFKQIKKKYGKGRDRKSEIRVFDNIEATNVVVANQKLYINREEGFAGSGLTKDEFVCECSDIDDIIVFREDGTFVVSKVSDKSYVGKNVIHIAIFKKNDERTIYNMIYRDGLNGHIMVKRFAVVGITRDKEYSLTKGTDGSKVLYFTANPNGEAETITIHLKPKPKLKNRIFDFDFSSLLIKGRSSMGNILTRFAVHKIVLKVAGESTLGSIDIWFDETVKRLNTDKYGKYIGSFSESDKILTIMQSGHYKLVNFDLSTHFDDDLIFIEKFNPKKIISAIYYDSEQKFTYLKRFQIEPSDKKVCFISETDGSRLIAFSIDKYPMAEIIFKKEDGKTRPKQEVNIAEFIDVKGVKAKGKRLSLYNINTINFLEPLPAEEEEEIVEEISDIEESTEDADNQDNKNDDIDDGTEQMKLF